MRKEPDGSMVPHAEMTVLGFKGFNEIVVDGRGNIYVNGGFDFEPGAGNAGIIALVTPEDPYAEWPTGSRFPTAWPSRPTTRR